MPIKGGFSGGTIPSMIELLEQASQDSNIRELLADPYCLNPPEADRGLDGPDRLTAFYDDDFAAWAAANAMAAATAGTIVQGDRDPGYGATAMGTALIDRLASNAGVRFALA